MKKLPILLLLLPLFLVGCKSNEEKAAELIKNELSKTLYDFESYSPIETVVTEAKQSVYTDTTLWAKAELMYETFNLAYELMQNAKRDKERMDIWGPPTAYSSSYSKANYEEYKKLYLSGIENSTKSMDLVKEMAKTLKERIKNIDSEKVVGWEVTHRFRCKTKGGQADIADYRYVIDQDFKKVLIREDMGEKSYKEIRELIDNAMNETL